MGQNVAYLDGHAFPFQPNSVDWSYTLNKASFDTVGGRVTQVLSVKIDTMTWVGDAGSRENLLNLYNTFKTIQDKQIKTETSSPLIIGSRDWYISVFARSMQISWDYQSVTYPYRMQFEVDEDFSGITENLTSAAIEQLAKNFKWSKDFSGLPGGTTNVNTDPTDILKDVVSGADRG